MIVKFLIIRFFFFLDDRILGSVFHIVAEHVSNKNNAGLLL